jgi:hypothetical protein
MLAWQFVKNDCFTISEALETAWCNRNLVKMMKNSIVEFEYKKVDGSTRLARGTLRQDMCPQVKSEKRTKNQSIQVYFDVDAGEWRCFKKCNLIT